jgi:hypothetical protein
MSACKCGHRLSGHAIFGSRVCRVCSCDDFSGVDPTTATRPAQEANRVDASDLAPRQDGPEVPDDAPSPRMCCDWCGQTFVTQFRPHVYFWRKARETVAHAPTRDDPPDARFIEAAIAVGKCMTREGAAGLWRGRDGDFWRKAREGK